MVPFMGAGRGWGKIRPSLPPPPPRKNIFVPILGAFLLLFLRTGAFLLRFSHDGGPFSPCGGLFATSYSSPMAPLAMLPPDVFIVIHEI